MLKNKDFKTIFCSAGNQCYQRKVVPQVNLVIPLVVNRLISVGELRAVAIKYLVELSVEHELFCYFFLREKLVMCGVARCLIGRIYVGDHLTLLHTKYISCGPHGFREDF